MLTQGSGISEEVIEARGYWTATDPDELASLWFAKYQCRVPALVIPVHAASGEILFHRIRPDDPRPDAARPDRFIKYEQPAGTPVTLDVPPSARVDLLDRSKRLWIVEGEKKADSLVSRGECAIALLGVWGWKRDNQILLDWEAVPTIGRELLIAFDSDVIDNYQVRFARQSLAEILSRRSGSAGLRRSGRE